MKSYKKLIMAVGAIPLCASPKFFFPAVTLVTDKALYPPLHLCQSKTLVTKHLNNEKEHGYY